MIRRPRRGVPAALTALALLTGCSLVAVVGIQLIAGRRPLISYDGLASTANSVHWNDLVLAVAAGLAVLIGLVLLLAALLPGTPTVLPIRPDGTRPELVAGAARRSLRATLRAAALSVDGVTKARLTLRRRTAITAVRTNRTNTDGLADAVRTAIEHRLDQICLIDRPVTRVRVVNSRTVPNGFDKPSE